MTDIVVGYGWDAAARDLNIKVPVVVRMEGTNVELGRKILTESGFNFAVAEDMRNNSSLGFSRQPDGSDTV